MLTHNATHNQVLIKLIYLDMHTRLRCCFEVSDSGFITYCIQLTEALYLKTSLSILRRRYHDVQDLPLHCVH